MTVGGDRGLESMFSLEIPRFGIVIPANVSTVVGYCTGGAIIVGSCGPTRLRVLLMSANI